LSLTCNSKREGGRSSAEHVAVARARDSAALGGEEVVLGERGKAKAARPIGDSSKTGGPALEETVVEGGDVGAGSAGGWTGGIEGVAANHQGTIHTQLHATQHSRQRVNRAS
jgi:hypothetical protein